MDYMEDIEDIEEDIEFDEMETDSMEDFWSYDGYDQEMEGFFSRKEEKKKPVDGDDYQASKKPVPEKNSPQPTRPQKANPVCPAPMKQPRSICPQSTKPGCSRPAKGDGPRTAACGQPTCPKKVKREGCVKKKRRAACPPAKKRQCRKKPPPPRSGNPFIIFFLKMLQRSKKQACEVAREAGKCWCRMSRDQKRRYEKMACMERKRRCKKQSKRKCG